MENELTFRVYTSGAGAVVSRDRDGEITLKLRAPGEDRAAVDALVDMLGVGDGTMVRLVALTDKG